MGTNFLKSPFYGTQRNRFIATTISAIISGAVIFLFRLLMSFMRSSSAWEVILERPGRL